MKKPMLIISAAALLANLAFALEIDTNLAKIDITAFKTANKTAVPSTFNDVNLVFQKVVEAYLRYLLELLQV